MLRIHKYKCRITGKESIIAHEYRHNKLVRSSPKCPVDVLPMLIKGHDLVELVNVHKASDLQVNVIKCNEIML